MIKSPDDIKPGDVFYVVLHTAVWKHRCTSVADYKTHFYINHGGGTTAATVCFKDEDAARAAVRRNQEVMLRALEKQVAEHRAAVERFREEMEQPIRIRTTMKATVIRLNREKHPNADRMFVQQVDGGVVCGSIQAWEGKELAVHIPPGAIVDTRREAFSWLLDPKLFNPAREGETRFHLAQASDRRGVQSLGFMTDAPEGAQEGDDVTEALGVTF